MVFKFPVTSFMKPLSKPMHNYNFQNQFSVSSMLWNRRMTSINPKRTANPPNISTNSLKSSPTSAWLNSNSHYSKLNELGAKASRGFEQLQQFQRGGNYRRRWVNEGNVIYGIIGVNTVVFLVWQWAEQNHRHLKDTSLYRFMIHHFTLGLHSSSFSWILANFSHKDFFHLLINMYVLYSFGTMLVGVLGLQRFLYLYAISALSTSACSMFFKYRDFDASRRVPAPSLGASGCTSGLLITYAMIYPWSTVHIIVFPVPAIVAIGGFALWDLYSTINRRGGLIDAAGHIGGGAGGLLYYMYALKR